MSSTSRSVPTRRITALVGSMIWLVSCSSSATEQSSAVETSSVATTNASATTPPAVTEPATTAPATTELATTQPATTVPAAGTPATVGSGPLQGLPAGVAGALPDGTYAVVVTDEDLAAVNIHPDEYPENHGTFTWTMAAGTWSWLQTADNVIQNPSDSGTYVVDGNHITFYVTSDLGPQEFTWEANADGTLQFAALPSTGKYYTTSVAAHPWVRQP